MPWTSLKIGPGVVRNATRYAVSGTWFDVSLVRFRDGFPERWGGWVDAYTGFNMVGMCRSLFRHGTLNGTRWVSAGTSKKFYMISIENRYDVSPYAETAGIGADSYPTPIALPNSLSTTSGSKVVKVTHTAHNHFLGDSVEIALAAAIGGVPAADINKEQLITGWIDENNYQITVATTASSTVANGGGAAVTVRYIYSPGSDNAVTNIGGWGYGVWSHEYGWGGEPAGAGTADQLGVWTHENWGEDLVACPNGGPIFYWNARSPANRMVNILDIKANYIAAGSPAADLNAPTDVQFIIVSHRDRHLLAFGGSIYMGSGAVEPMTVRWCDQENITNWNEASLSGTAGSLPLSNGSKFLSGIATQREILAWSDQALYSIQYVGAPFVYTADIIDKWSDICGLKARCNFGGVVYWMGNGGFYAYSGRTDVLPCTVWDYISRNLNRDQMIKVYAGSNQQYNEVLFFYPSVDSIEVDSYVAFDVVQKIWTYGILGRTAWMDIDAVSPVIAAEPVPTGARLFEHDHGSDDGSTTPASPVIAYIESGPIELSSDHYEKGDRMMFVRRLIPDVTFRNIETSVTAPQMNIVLKMMDFPGTGFGENSSNAVARTAVVPVEMFDDDESGDGQGYVRLRGRSLTMRAESDSLGSEWRLGIVRIDARTDGQR